MKRQTVFAVVLLSLLVGLSSVAIAEEKGNGLFQGFPIVNLKVNGKAVQSDVPAINFNGRTLVPFRAIGDAIGATVGWDGETQTASLETPDLEAKVQVLQALFDAVKPSAMGGAVVPSTAPAGPATLKVVGWGLPVKNVKMAVTLVREGLFKKADGSDYPPGPIDVTPNALLQKATGYVSPVSRVAWPWALLSREIPGFISEPSVLGAVDVDDQGRFAGEFRTSLREVGPEYVWLVPVWEPGDETSVKTAIVDLADLTVGVRPNLVIGSLGRVTAPPCVIDDGYTTLGLTVYGLEPGTPIRFTIDSEPLMVRGSNGPVPARNDGTVLAGPKGKASNPYVLSPFSPGTHKVQVFQAGVATAIAEGTFEVRPRTPITVVASCQVQLRPDGKVTLKGEVRVSGLWPDCEVSVWGEQWRWPSPDGTLTVAISYDYDKSIFPLTEWVSQEGRPGVKQTIDLPVGP